jgi:hypothetical protein
MPSDQQWPQAVEARFFRSSHEEMARAYKYENKHEDRQEKAAENLLAREFHYC